MYNFSDKYLVRKFLFLLISMILFTCLATSIYAQDKFYTYYERGLKYMQQQDWERAITEFKSAASLEFEDKISKRTYGTHFIQYLPHQQMGIAFYNLGEYSIAKRELALSLAYYRTNETEKHYQKVANASDLPPETTVVKENVATNNFPPKAEKTKQVVKTKQVEKPKVEEKLKPTKPEVVQKPVESAEQKEIRLQKEELDRQKADFEKQKKNYAEQKQRISSSEKLPAGALTYDPSKVTQVGSRLSVAVLPFTMNGEGQNISSSVTEKLITQLVNLRRFRVIERNAMDKIMNEQTLGMTGVVDENTAAKVGKLVGADIIILGSITYSPGFVKVTARCIDTETAETIVAKDASTQNNDLRNVDHLVENVAIMIYNALPLVEGDIINTDGDQVYLDIGSAHGLMKGTKCIVFREGEVIKHPTTGQILGKKVTKLGEISVVEVQEKMAIAKVLNKEGTIQTGDKIVVK